MLARRQSNIKEEKEVTISKELPELTPRQQKIFDLWDSMSIIEIGTAMSMTSGAVTAQARFVRAKG